MAVGYEFKKHHTITMKNNINHKGRKDFRKGRKEIMLCSVAHRSFRLVNY